MLHKMLPETSLGYMIQDTRKERRMTVEELALKTSLSIGSIRAYEQGRRIPSAKALNSIIDCLNIGGSWLSNSVWKTDNGIVYELAPFSGGHKRKIHEEVVQIESLRLNVVKKILEVDVDTLKAISQLLK